MTLTISFEDRDYVYSIDWNKIAPILKVSEEQLTEAVRKVLSHA